MEHDHSRNHPDSHSRNHPDSHSRGQEQFTQDFWDDRYGSAGQLWSGQPNLQLVAQVADLTPGDALDAGCGEGGDAVWLAAAGWHVTAVDVSAVAMARGAHQAAVAGPQIAARITWQREDLLTWDPGPGRFDLVSAQFMHLPMPVIKEVHRRLAAAVRPGGTLVIVSHHPDDLPADHRANHAGAFRLAEEIAADLDPADWEIIVADAIGRIASGRLAEVVGDGAQVRDTVLRARRR